MDRSGCTYQWDSLQSLPETEVKPGLNRDCRWVTENLITQSDGLTECNEQLPTEQLPTEQLSTRKLPTGVRRSFRNGTSLRLSSVKDHRNLLTIKKKQRGLDRQGGSLGGQWWVWLQIVTCLFVLQLLTLGAESIEWL